MPSIRSAAALKRGDDRGLRRLRAVGRDHARILQGGDLLLELAHLLRRLPTVRRRPSAPPSRSAACRRSRRTGRAARSMRSSSSLASFAQMVLLAVLAGHAELAAVDGDVHLRHGTSSDAFSHPRHGRLLDRAPTGCSRSPHRAGARSRDWWLRAGARARSAPSRSAASRERSAPSACTCSASVSSLAVGLAPALDRGLERIQRQRQAPGRRRRICARDRSCIAIRLRQHPTPQMRRKTLNQQSN